VTSPRDVLAGVVGDVARLTDHVRERRPLWLPAAERDPEAVRAAVALLSVADVDRLVATSGLRAPAFRMVREGRTLPIGSLTRKVRIGSRPVDDLVDVDAVHDALAEGATLVLQGLHRSWPPVANVCRALEDALTHPAQANAYLTPPVAQGLNLHADPHDVVVVQTAGRKRWVVRPDGEAAWDLELGPGDVLYLPSGTRHAAQTLDEPSLHLTLGVRTVSWRHLVRRAIDEVAGAAGLDDPLPPGWAAAPDELASGLRDRLAEVVAALERDPTAWCHAEADAFRRSRPADGEGRVLDLLEVARLSDGHALAWREVPALEAGPDGTVDLVGGGRRLRFPGHLREALVDVTRRARFRPGELDDVLDGDSRQVLCRRLVREGLLAVVRPTTGGT
jgi:lysine-specific demethylase/histidyl-hydroxylase NO66